MVILFLSLGYFILSAGLLLQRGVSGIVALAVSAIFVIFARKHLLAASLLLFFLMPIAGFLDNISSKAQAIPVLLGPLSGWGLGAALSPRPTGTTSNNNHRFLALISLGSAITVFSALLASGRYLHHVWPNLNGIVAPQIEGWQSALTVKNALGWVMRGLVLYSGGWLLAVHLGRFGEWGYSSFRRVFLGMVWGIVPAIALGGYQTALNIGFLNTHVFAAMRRVNATFADPNALGLFLAMAIPLIIVLFMESHGLWKVFYLTHLVGDVFLIAQSGTRVAFLAVGVSFAILIICWSFESRKPAVASFATVLLAVGIVWATSSSRLPILQRAENSLKGFSFRADSMKAYFEEPSSRWQMWRRSWKMICERPLLGSGAGTFLIEARRLAMNQGVATPNDTAGNFYLQVWEEIGVAGFGCLVILIICTLRQGWRRVRQSSSPLDQASLAGFAGMCVALLFGSHLLRIESALLFWTYAAVLWREPGL